MHHVKVGAHIPRPYEGDAIAPRGEKANSRKLVGRGSVMFVVLSHADAGAGAGAGADADADADVDAGTDTDKDADTDADTETERERERGQTER